MLEQLSGCLMVVRRCCQLCRVAGSFLGRHHGIIVGWLWAPVQLAPGWHHPLPHHAPLPGLWIVDIQVSTNLLLTLACIGLSKLEYTGLLPSREESGRLVDGRHWKRFVLLGPGGREQLVVSLALGLDPPVVGWNRAS
jgi:hypothetical protein